jgi:putative ABC transport system permease protein
MKILFGLAWRNLWRNKRRSLIVIISVAIGIFVMLLSIGILNGVTKQMIDNAIKTSLGNIAIHAKGFQDDMNLNNNFNPSEKILEAIAKEPLVKGYSPRIKIQGMIRSSETSMGVIISGIDPKKEKIVSNIYKYIVKDNESTYLENGDEDYIILSKASAKKLNLVVGNRVVLMFQDVNNEIIGISLKIKGLFQTPVESFDKYSVFMSLGKLQKTTGLKNNISEIVIVSEGGSSLDNIKTKLMNSINNNNLEILTWKEMAPNFVKAITLFDAMMYIFFSIVFITILFTLVNALVMAVMERFHEIGIMKAIGTRPSWIFSIIMIESVNLGIIGLFAGFIVSVVLVGILGYTGIDLSIFVKLFRSLGSGSVLYPNLKAMDIIIAIFIVFFTSIIASLYPATKAAKIKPLDAIHYI